MTDNDDVANELLDPASKSSFRTIPLLLRLLPSMSNVFTFFGSKLFLLFRLDADEGEVDKLLKLLSGDIGNEIEVSFFKPFIENCDVGLFNIVASVEMDDVNLIRSDGLVVDVISLNNDCAGIAILR